MPDCGSQITICDLPVRFDTYKGCTHACSYCFVQSKYDIAKIEKGEGEQALRNFIAGQRSAVTSWCDWDIPLHWGGVSDPFQPAERIHRLSYRALEIFAETGYPFVVSTKGELLGDDGYIDLLSRCNCVVQVSLVGPKYDDLEKGAPSFAERLRIIEKVAPHVKRVIIRAQPYMVEVLKDVLLYIPAYKDAGVHGITIEGMKYKRKRPGLVRVAGDFCYPVKILRSHYELIRDKCHAHGLSFYCAENRLRMMGDSLCCCGIDGLDRFSPNTYNLNHHLYDPAAFVPTEAMKQPGTARCYSASCQNSFTNSALAKMSLAECINIATKDKALVSALIEK